MLFGSELPLEAGEQRVLRVRSHSWPVVRAALPLLVPAVAPGLYAMLDAAAPGLRLSRYFPLFLWVAGVAAACYPVKWGAPDLLPWTRRIFVPTNPRPITPSRVLA